MLLNTVDAGIEDLVSGATGAKSDCSWCCCGDDAKTGCVVCFFGCVGEGWDSCVGQEVQMSLANVGCAVGCHWCWCSQPWSCFAMPIVVSGTLPLVWCVLPRAYISVLGGKLPGCGSSDMVVGWLS